MLMSLIDCMDFEGECMNDRFFLQCMVLADMDQLSEYLMWMSVFLRFMLLPLKTVDRRDLTLILLH